MLKRSEAKVLILSIFCIASTSTLARENDFGSLGLSLMPNKLTTTMLIEFDFEIVGHLTS